MENDIKEIKRENMDFVQKGRGLKKFYGKIKDCDGYNLQNVMMGLSEDWLDRILCCVQLYLSGHIVIEDENLRKIVDEKEYMNKDLIDFASNRYSLKQKKKFLCSQTGDRGNDVVVGVKHVVEMVVA